MTDSEILTLKNKAKSKVRIMVKSWMYGNIEMHKTLLTLSDALIQGTIDDETIDSVFRDRLICHIAHNRVKAQNVFFITVFWDLIKEVLIEESRAMQN